MLKHTPFIVAAAIGLAGCEQVNQRLGLEDPVKKEARLEAEGKAVGSACRHSGRAIEDCYSIYRWLAKANIYAGWMEMDTYMRENGIETIAPQLPPAPPPEPPEKKKKKKPKAEGENPEGAAPKEGEAPAGDGKEAAKDAKDPPPKEPAKPAKH
ncbi:hypothetical protein VX159_03595 [Dechloromonas sp. ZY10]|uniref:hypothetical protein n=1 Tax=Dechloromonas aquae TaxID=2664436 RepID=UPI00352895AC